MMWLHVICALLLINYASGPKTDQLRASVTNQEQRAFIKCHVLLGTSTSDVYKMLEKIARRQALSQSQTYELYKEFKEGTRLMSENAPHEGRPREATDEAHKEKLKQLLLEDRNWGTYELGENLGVSYWSTMRLLKEVGAKKITTRWVPHDLTPTQKQKRVDICAEHLESYNNDPEFLERIIAIDETLIRSYDPKDSFNSRQWRLPGQEPYVILT
jgi:transposase